MTTMTTLSRRTFIASSAAAGGGLALGFHLPGTTAPAQTAAAASTAVGTNEINAWVVVKPDDSVVIRIARSEMGQGTSTGLAQLVAEELECDWNKVSIEYPTPGQNLARKRVWGDMSTGGSRGLRGSQDYVRKGGATAREMLIAAAAAEWKVPAAECVAANSVISHKVSGRSVTFGKMATAAAKLTPPADVKLKDPKDWKVIGKPMKRLDTAEKVNGKLVYAIDTKLPGMLNAAIKDCPVFGGKIKSFDAAKVAGMPGVKTVVQVGDTGVAVVADTWWRAKTALDTMPIVWDEGPNAKVSSASIAAFLKEGLDTKEPLVGQKVGDAAVAIAGAAKKVEATYGSPFLNHATMEPMNCTALVTAEKCEVWTATQNGEAALSAASRASGLPLEKCEVYKTSLGGGFGRRGNFHDYVVQAVQVAAQVKGTPVKLIWSREEDMIHGFYRPITMCRLSGGLDDKGNLVGLHARFSGQSIIAQHFPQRLAGSGGVDTLFFQGLLADEFSYTIPNLTIDKAMRNTHVPVGFWRGVNHNQNAIYVECFMDELALAAGKDPLAFRQALMTKHPKQLAVLNAAAEKGDWGKPLASGVHRGICQNTGFGSHTAAVAEVSVDKGKVKVHRLVIAVDCGHAANPEQIAHQTEGSVVYGLGAMFYQENTIKDGRVVEQNFDTFPSLLMDEMPKVETIVMTSGGFWGGIGEPTIAVAAPAVLNAIFAATGKRVRELPLKHTKLT